MHWKPKVKLGSSKEGYVSNTMLVCQKSVYSFNWLHVCYKGIVPFLYFFFSQTEKTTDFLWVGRWFLAWLAFFLLSANIRRFISRSFTLECSGEFTCVHTSNYSKNNSINFPFISNTADINILLENFRPISEKGTQTYLYMKLHPVFQKRSIFDIIPVCQIRTISDC